MNASTDIGGSDCVMKALPYNVESEGPPQGCPQDCSPSLQKSYVTQHPFLTVVLCVRQLLLT